MITRLTLLVQQASLMFCIISFASSRAFGLCCCLALPELPVAAPFIGATSGGRCCVMTLATLIWLDGCSCRMAFHCHTSLERRSVDLPILMKRAWSVNQPNPWNGYESLLSQLIWSFLIWNNWYSFIWNLLCVSTDWILRRFESIGIASSIIDGCYQLLV